MRVLSRRGKMNRAFHIQKRHARLRGIGFHFSFSDWVSWWEAQLGEDWLEKRGCRRGQYVMARLADQGDYRPTNVKCILCSENQSEQLANGTSPSGWNKGLKGRPKKGNKLSRDAVQAIYASQGSQREIAGRFGVTQSTVSRIRARTNWGWLTQDIEEAQPCAS